MANNRSNPTFQPVGAVKQGVQSGSDELVRGHKNAKNGSRQQSLLAPSRAVGLTVWFTGLSSAGKTTICQALSERLCARGYRVECLDGDVVRQSLSKDLGFSKKDRDENVRRIGFVAELLTRHGVIVLVSAISPYAAVRDEMRRAIGHFLEVFVRSFEDMRAA